MRCPPSPLLSLRALFALASLLQVPVTARSHLRLLLRPLTAFTGTRCLPFLCCSLSPMHALAHCLLSPMLCLLSALISCPSLCFLSPTHSPSAHPRLCLHSLPALAYGRPLCLVSPTRALAVCSLAYTCAQCPLSPIPAVRSLIWFHLCPLWVYLVIFTHPRPLSALVHYDHVVYITIVVSLRLYNNIQCVNQSLFK